MDHNPGEQESKKTAYTMVVVLTQVMEQTDGNCRHYRALFIAKDKLYRLGYTRSPGIVFCRILPSESAKDVIA